LLIVLQFLAASRHAPRHPRSMRPSVIRGLSWCRTPGDRPT